MAGKRPRHVVDERPALTTAGSAVPLGAMTETTREHEQQQEVSASNAGMVQDSAPLVHTQDGSSSTGTSNSHSVITRAASAQARGRRVGATAGIVSVAEDAEDLPSTHSNMQGENTTTTTTASDLANHFAIPAAVLQRISDRLYPTNSSAPSPTPPLAQLPATEDVKNALLQPARDTAHDAEDVLVPARPASHTSRAAAAAAVVSKPLIASRSWREALLRGEAGEARAGQPAKRVTHRTHEGDEMEVEAVVREKAVRDEIGDDVIHFDRAVRSTSPSSSSSASWQSDEEEKVEEEEEDEEDGMSDAEEETVNNRKKRKAAHAHTSTRHARGRLDHHLAAFDSAFLAREEATLLHSDKSEGEDEEEDEALMLSVSELGSEVEEDDNAAKNGEEEDVTKADTKPMSGGGFGAMDRMRLAAEQKTTARRTYTAEVATGNEEEGEGKDRPAASSSSSPPLLTAAATTATARSIIRRFRGVYFQCHTPPPPPPPPHEASQNDGHSGTSSYSCHHTLLGLRGALTIQGPCGLIGLGAGEAAVQGFMLGRKQLTLWSAEQRVVLQRIETPLKTRASLMKELPRPQRLQRMLAQAHVHGGGGGGDGDELAHKMNAVLQPGQFVHAQAEDTTQGTADKAPHLLHAAETAAMMYDVENVFGSVDWDWVEATVQAWRRTLGSSALSELSLVLVLQSQQTNWSTASSTNAGARYAAPMRRHYLSAYSPAGGGQTQQPQQYNSKGNGSVRQKTDSYMEVPAFFARHAEPSIDLALLDKVVPSIATQGTGACIVVGSKDIGKSTLCRFLTNALVSQHGSCFWFDLDLGQPEVGLPGQLGLHRVHYPLLRPHDRLCAELIAARFLGSVTLRCPKSAAQAVAHMCDLVRQVARHAPVVINTHGWVLQTGRRLTSEVIRRVRPQHAIHLLHSYEEEWLREPEAVLRPSCGLNAEVVHRRFLVRWLGSAYRNNNDNTSDKSVQDSSKANNSKSKQVNGKAGQRKRARTSDNVTQCEAAEQSVSPTAWLACLPHAESVKKQKNTAGAEAAWKGQVHLVRVVRDEEEGQRTQRSRPELRKGSSARQARWQSYLAPLLQYYRAQQQQRQQQQQHGQELHNREEEGGRTEVEGEEDNTTLLQAPLHHLHRIVLADRDESDDLHDKECGNLYSKDESARRIANIAALLEHSVVAVQFRRLRKVEAEMYNNDKEAKGVRVCSLASLPGGFEVSCYGYVESSERELSGANAWQEPRVALRVPLARRVVAAMLRSTSTECSKSNDNEEEGCVVISIAHAAALREDTAFMEQYP